MRIADLFRKLPRGGRATVALLLACLAAGCEGLMSSLDPQGPAARELAQIWWVMFWASVVLFAGTMALVLYAVFSRAERRPELGSGMRLVIGGGIVLPLLTVLPLLVYGVGIGSGQSSAQEPAAVTIEVVGHRFWWEVRYQDPAQPGAMIVSANEIHLPAGVPVDIMLSSEDVIHSFWVPNLAGKLDAIPGRTNRLRLVADQPGLYRGQCAEYCGAQHARMAFYVRAHEPGEFERWLQRQRGSAPTPESDLQQRGREVFASAGCMECHTIRGTDADGRIGPDLTRVGGRLTLGAGTLENSREALAEWVAHNQRLKPGNRMLPFDHLDEESLEALSVYLESLQ